MTSARNIGGRACLRYEAQAEAAMQSNEPKKYYVHEIITRCSIAGLKMDIAILSHDKRLLLGCTIVLKRRTWMEIYKMILPRKQSSS